MLTSGWTSAQEPQERIAKFVEETWRPEPSTIDLTVFRTYNRRPIDAKDETSLRRMYERMLNIKGREPYYQRLWAEYPELREKGLAERIAGSLASHREEMFVCNRYRLTKKCSRVEQTIFENRETWESQRQVGPPNEFTKTFCNSLPTLEGLKQGFDYDRELKQAHHVIQRNHPAWKRNEVSRFRTIGLTNLLLIRAATRKQQLWGGAEPPLDRNLVKQLADGGTVGGLRIAYEAAVMAGSEPIDRFTLMTSGLLPVGTGHKAAVIETEPNEPGHVLRIETYDLNGRLIQLETRTSYRPDGFPGSYRVETYHEDGWTEYDESSVVDVCVD